MVVFDLIRKLRTNTERIEIYGTGEEIRDFLYVEDTAAAVIEVMMHGELKGEAYNMAAGQGTAIKDIVEILISIMEVSPQICYTGKGRPGNPIKWIADITKIKALGFRPTISLENGLKQVVQWYDSL